MFKYLEQYEYVEISSEAIKSVKCHQGFEINGKSIDKNEMNKMKDYLLLFCDKHTHCNNGNHSFGY